MKKKGWTSLTVKLNGLILVIVLVLSIGLAAFAYEVNKSRVDSYYKQTTSRAASAVAAFVDGDRVEALLQAIKTEEFREKRDLAIAADDDTLITDWLKEKDLYSTYLELDKMLGIYRERLNAEYVYLQSLERNESINIVDPDEDIFYVGSLEVTPEGYTQFQSNQHIDPIVTTTEYGWLCSAYEPVVNSEGRNVAMVGVDINMDDVMQERQQFLATMMLFAVALMVVSSIVTVMLMNRMATKPLSMLAKATTGFADDQTGYQEEKIINLPINSKDEIGDLYQEIRVMQGRIVEYLNNLTQVTAEKERIGAELNIAAQIQLDMLPRVFPAFPDRHDFDIYARMIPAREVGGDFYDFFLVDDDHLCLVMADVSGKGVPASLFMTVAKSLIKSRAQLGEQPAELLYNVNNQLCDGNDAELFVTVWMAIIQLSTGKGVAANAGHEHPVIRRKNGQFELVTYRHSPAVATMEGIRFRQHEFELDPGDTLFVYTDGVPEATNSKEELFGTDRMLHALNTCPGDTPKQLLKAVRDEIDDFVGDAPQFDDITMMAFAYTGPEGRKTEKVTLTVDAKAENLDQVLAFTEKQLEEAGCPMKVLTQIDVAVEEVFVNIANYAYGEGEGQAQITVETGKEPKEAIITFRDKGVEFNPLAKEDPDTTLSAEERQIGGLGIYIVKKTMNEVEYKRIDGENVLTIRKVF